MTDRKGTVVWFTGLSGSGKTTLAAAVAGRLRQSGWTVKAIDGDELRHGLCAGLGFSRQDREENVRRAACLAREFADHVDFVLVALIAPYRALRAEAAAKLPKYIEVYVNAPLSTCEARDPKGLYLRARAGQLRNFTGLDDPYEPPAKPALEVRTDQLTVEQSVDEVLRCLHGRTGGAEDLVALLRAALDADPALTLAGISQRIGVTPHTLAVRLRKSGNRNYRAVRAEQLLAAALKLLRSQLSVKEVAFQLGFGSPESFGRFVRRASGSSPRSFKVLSETVMLVRKS